MSDKYQWDIEDIEIEEPVVEGGAGSGNFGHAGRPGEVGGSGEGGAPASASEWKPEMTKGKAEEWAKDSVVKEYQYHSTYSEAAEKIITEGFRFDKYMGCYGAGIYMAEGQPETGYGEHALELQVNVKSVFEWSTGGDFKGDHYPTEIAAALWYRENYRDVPFSDKANSSGMIRLYVQHLGHDAIRVSGTRWGQRWLVVLDAKNITVVSHGHKIRYQKAESLQEGGEGSGNFDHAGRPGEVGGSGTRHEVTLKALEAAGYEVLTAKGGYHIKGKGFLTTAQAHKLIGSPAYDKVARSKTRQVPWGDYATIAAMSGISVKTGKPIKRETLRSKMLRIKALTEGGAGSGNFGHAGRPGEVGGSGEGGPLSDDEKTAALSVLDKLPVAAHPWDKPGSKADSIDLKDVFSHPQVSFMGGQCTSGCE